MARIFIGVGHGGSDPGATGNNRIEKLVNLSVATSLQKYLTINGQTVLISRTNDRNQTINDKVAMSNAFNSDICMDIHFNAFNKSAHGTSCYYKNKSTNGKKIATAISSEIAKLGVHNRGAVTNVQNGVDYFGMIRTPKAPIALLVECMFIDSPTDFPYFNNDAKLDKISEQIARGICSFLGITFKTSVTVAPPTINHNTITIGAKVKIKGGAKYGGLSSDNNKLIPTSVVSKIHTVLEIRTLNGVPQARLKEINSWVRISDLNVHTSAVATTKTLKVGAKVKIKAGAKYGGLGTGAGKKVPDSVIVKTHTVAEMKTINNVKQSRLKEINSWVKDTDLTLV